MQLWKYDFKRCIKGEGKLTESSWQKPRRLPLLSYFCGDKQDAGQVLLHNVIPKEIYQCMQLKKKEQKTSVSRESMKEIVIIMK